MSRKDLHDRTPAKSCHITYFVTYNKSIEGPDTELSSRASVNALCSHCSQQGTYCNCNSGSEDCKIIFTPSAILNTMIFSENDLGQTLGVFSQYNLF